MNINIRVIREVLRCSKCKKTSEFLYLSDFSYGERLIRFGDKQYAYINLIEDDTFNNFEKLLIGILKQYDHESDKEEIANILNETFGIACDKISGSRIDFSRNEEICSYCSSTDFDNIMVEPETDLDIDVPVITHEQWNILSTDNKKELIENELKQKEII